MTPGQPYGAEVAVRRVLIAHLTSTQLLLPLLTDLAPHLANPTPAPDAVQLSPREHQVLQLIADGHPTDAIADHLGISPGTAKSHTQRLLTTLSARNRAHAVHLGHRAALLTTRTPT